MNGKLCNVYRTLNLMKLKNWNRCTSLWNDLLHGSVYLLWGLKNCACAILSLTYKSRKSNLSLVATYNKSKRSRGVNYLSLSNSLMEYCITFRIKWFWPFYNSFEINSWAAIELFLAIIILMQAVIRWCLQTFIWPNNALLPVLLWQSRHQLSKGPFHYHKTHPSTTKPIPLLQGPSLFHKAHLTTTRPIPLPQDPFHYHNAHPPSTTPISLQKCSTYMCICLYDLLLQIVNLILLKCSWNITNLLLSDWNWVHVLETKYGGQKYLCIPQVWWTCRIRHQDRIMSAYIGPDVGHTNIR